MMLLALPVLLAGQCVSASPPDSVRTAWVAQAWATSVRPALAADLGLRWDGAHWELDPSRADAPNIAATAYFVQPLLDAGISFALSRCGRGALDEIAEYYLAAAGRFRTFGDLARVRGRIVGRGRPGDFVGDSTVRTLPWIHEAEGSTPARSAECLLCVAQFLHPAARLIHLFAVLPPGERGELERRFVATYVPLIARDQVLRFAYATPLDLHLTGGPISGAVAGWRAQLGLAAAQRTRYPDALLDVQLWLLAEGAELCAAHAADPGLIALDGADQARLLEFVRVGTLRLAQSAVVRTAFLGGSATPVRTLDFLEGEFSRHRDDAFAGDSGPDLPGGAGPGPVDSIGWDVGHAIRFPPVLRSLYDARVATGAAFPADSDMAAAAHQLSYRVFEGDLTRPLFRNFMDGTDGWYRVGYARRGRWGWPPSHHCDGADPARPCLGAGILAAWGTLAPFDPRLDTIAEALVTLAASNDPVAIRFRDRYYFRDVPYSFAVADGARPSLLLFELLANFARPSPAWDPANVPR